MTTAAQKPSADRSGPRSAVPVVQPGIRIDPIRVLRQNQWKIVIGVVIGVLCGAGAKMVFDRTYPLYSGRVLFELRHAITNPDDIVAGDSRNEETVERLAQTEASRLTSRELLLKAIRKRDIENTEWCNKFKQDGQFVADLAVDALERELRAGFQKRTQYFSLSWSTNVDADVPIVLNAVADTYIEVRKSEDDRRFTQNSDVFSSTAKNLDSDLKSLADQIFEFISKNNMGSRDGGAGDIVQRMDDTGRRMNETKGQLSVAISQRNQAWAKLQGTMAPSAEDVRTAEEDPVVQRINSSLKDVRISLDLAAKKFTPDHREYIGAQRTVNAVEQEHDVELKKVLRRNLTADLKLFGDRSETMAELLRSYEEDFAKQELRLKDFTAASAQLNQMTERQRRMEEQRSKMLDVMNQLNSLKAREDARAVTIAQRALTPRERSFPKWTIMVPLGALLGLVSVLGVAFLREVLDQRVRYASDLAGMHGRLLGVIPDVADDPTGVKRAENAIREAPQSVLAESLRQTASHVQKHMRGHKTLLVIGGLPGAGVTAIITNLAESIASSGRRVLLVDADLRRPTLGKALGVNTTIGLGDVLAGKAKIEDVITEVSEQIYLIGAGSPEHRVFERLATAAADDFLAQAKSMFDIVVIDAPPAIVAGDAMILAAKVDATVLVVRAFQEQRGLVSRLIAQLNDMPSQFVGIVFNRPRNTAGGYFRKNYEAMAGYSSGK